MSRIIILILLISTSLFSQETGLNQIENFNDLALLRNDVLSLHQSSHDPDGGNNHDGFTGGNFTGTYNGENIMLHAKGRGIINRIWITGFDLSKRIKIYFDGSSNPKINETLADFFSGTHAPYLSPLVVNDAVSSGGFTSYMPFPFEEEIMITVEGGSNHEFFNIDYQLYGNDNSDISTWTGSEDLSATYNIFNNKGADPRGDVTYTSVENTFDVSSSETVSALTISESNSSVASLLVTIPGIEFNDESDISDFLTDHGKAHKTTSEFTMDINPNASVIKLKRRLDYAIADQEAKIYVDNNVVGNWKTAGRSSNSYRWREVEFDINLKDFITPGNTTITIKTEFVASQIDWNEFYYWTICDGVVTDEFDVGDVASESSHNYNSISAWQGYLSAILPKGGTPANSILDDVSLQVFFDGESSPSVDAPLAYFFAVGSIEQLRIQSLPVGVKPGTNTLYSYFPMPFSNNCEFKLVNNSGVNLPGIHIEVDYQSIESDFSDLGYFKTQYNHDSNPEMGKDYKLLDARGRGKYVGVVMEVSGGENDLWLEGDERFYIDGSNTPAIYGTGTEDYFNGAWYFNRGLFDLSTHGMTGMYNSDRSVYRFHLSDPVYFNSKADFGIEHGPVNDFTADYKSLAFYYLKPETSFTKTDEVIIGDNTSESNHNYKTTGSDYRGTAVSYYEGDNDEIALTKTVRYINGSSEFNVNITSGKIVWIKRTFDYSLENQDAKVYVDGQLIGNWFSAGRNANKRFRDEYFSIPAAYTKSKTQITLKFEAIDNSVDYKWSESKYEIYSVDGYNLSNEDPQILNAIKVYPNPSSGIINIDSSVQVEDVIISDVNGRVINNITFTGGSIDISTLNKGVYFMSIITRNGNSIKTIIKK
ncbi:MAG: DUF2961 domain-containing protein [Bacteroidota bacterium]